MTDPSLGAAPRGEMRGCAAGVPLTCPTEQPEPTTQQQRFKSREITEKTVKIKHVQYNGGTPCEPWQHTAVLEHTALTQHIEQLEQHTYQQHKQHTESHNQHKQHITSHKQHTQLTYSNEQHKQHRDPREQHQQHTQGHNKQHTELPEQHEQHITSHEQHTQLTNSNDQHKRHTESHEQHKQHIASPEQHKQHTVSPAQHKQYIQSTEQYNQHTQSPEQHIEYRARLLDLIRRDDADVLLTLHRTDPERFVQQLQCQHEHVDLSAHKQRIEEFGKRPQLPDCPLHLAAWYGSDAALGVLVEEGGLRAGHRTAGDGSTALHHAAHGGCTSTCRLLLAHGALINAADVHGRTPLHLCVTKAHMDTTRMLLRTPGCDVTLCTKPSTDSSTVLHLAVSKGYVTLSRLLLDHSACDVINTEQMQTRRTALHLAAHAAIPALTDLLLLRGACADARDVKGQTPLALATQTKGGLRQDRIRLVDTLASAGDVNLGDNVGLRPLHHAAYLNRPGMVEALLRAGASVNTAGDYGCSPLHYAFLNHTVSSKAARALLGARADVTLPDHEGRTALHMYVQHEAPPSELGAQLLSSGALINVADRLGRAPLHHAVQRSSLAAVQLLLGAGASLDAADDSGDTALHYATRRDRNACDHVTLLVQTGCGLEVPNTDGCRAMHEAARRMHVDVLRVLLQHGACVNATDGKDRTPLHVAMETLLEQRRGSGSGMRPEMTAQFGSAVTTLLSFGASVSLPDADHVTFVDHMMDVHESVSVAPEVVGAVLGRWQESGRTEVRRALSRALQRQNFNFLEMALETIGIGSQEGATVQSLTDLIQSL